MAALRLPVVPVTVLSLALLFAIVAAAAEPLAGSDASNKTELPEGEAPPALQGGKTAAERALVGLQRQFSIKRREQVEAADTIFEKPSYHKRYDLVKPLLDELFRVLKKAQHTLLRVEPELLDGRLPLQDEAALDALVRLWENTAFFGDLILRLPDIVHSQYDGHAVRTDLLRYALDLSLQSPVFAEDSPHRAQLLLVMQETGMAETPDPAYTNPFREDNVRRQVHAARERQVKLDREAAKREKRQALRQPRLRGAHQEL